MGAADRTLGVPVTKSPSPSPSATRRRVSRAVPPAYQRRQYLTGALFIAACAAILPLLLGDLANQHRVNLWIAYAIAAIGFYWVFGLAGRFAFCQTFMMALGGFTSAWITRTLGDGWFLLGLGGAMVACAVTAALIGLATARSKEFYFAVGTLAVAEVGAVVLREATGFTGPNGTAVGVSAPRIGSIEFLTEGETFWLFLAVLAVVLLIAAFIERSPMGRDATAARLIPTVAATAGVPTLRVPLVLFSLGSAAGGLSGALIAHWTGSISTDSFGISLAIGIFMMLIVGGIGSVWGPIIGAAVYVAVPQLLQGFAQWQLIVYGAFLLAAIIGMPRGIVGAVQAVVARLRRRGRTTVIESVDDVASTEEVSAP